MYDFMYKCKGAISIFLVIVLVPMLVLSSIFVDMSRIKLAESVAKSSGELTLNTALTNYDAVLKDMYGLFATSQNTDELFENLENYYRQCIEAAGVAEADADNYVDQIMQFVRSQAGTDDLMNMNLTSFEVTKPTGGSLANPAVLKSQIVEFMKYRAPINLGTGIFDALRSMKNLKKQNELVKNKNKFYDQQTSMMEKLESVWNDLENYQYRDAVWPGDTNSAHGFPQGSYMSDYAARMNDCVEPLKTSIAYIVRYLYFADTNYGNVGYSASEPFGVSVNTSPSDSANSQVWTVTQTDKTTYNVKTNPDSVTVDELKSYLKTAYKAIKNVSSVTSEYETIAQGNASLSDTEKIRIVTKVNSALNSGYQANIKNLVANMVNLKNAYEAIEPDDIKDLYVVVSGSNVSFYDASTDPEGRNKPSGATKMSSFIQSQLSSHLTVDSNGNITDNDIRIYNGLMSRAKQYYSDTSGVVSAAKTYVNQHADAAYNYASSFDSFLEEKIGKLQNAATTLTTIKSELNNSESDYNKALSAWKNSANGLSGDTMGQENMSEIQKLEKVLTVSKVDKLITRVNDAKASLESVKNQVAGYKALGKSWKDFVDSGDVTYSKVLGFLSAAQKQKIDNVAKSSQIATETVNGTATAKYDKAYDSVVSELTSTVLTQTIKTSWSAAEAAKSPDLTKNQVELYTWLYNNFCNQSQLTSKYGTARGHGQYTQGTEPAASTNISDHKGDADSAQSNMDDKAKSNKDTATKSTETPPNRNYNTSFLPSGEWEALNEELAKLQDGGDTNKTSDQMLEDSTSALNMFDSLFEMVGNMATTLRDDMYVTNYIMNMFSYSTYESEITVKNKNATTAFDSWYEWNGTENQYKLKSNFSSYTNSQQMLKDARTLTKVSINPNANYLYGQEVEYIIYGQGGLTKAYGTIYMLRFALNTIYAFTDAEIGNITTAAATALFGTPPLTPLIPVAKVAMTLGLALAESGYDLYQLKSGEQIPLMKNNKSWVMKPTNAAKAVAGEILNDVASVAVDEGVKILNNALDMTNDELNDLINRGEIDLNKLAQEATYSTINELKNYGNQAVQEIMNICNEINTEAMEKVDYVQGKTTEKVNAAIQKLDAWLATQGSSESDVVYLAKKTAVNYLKENNGAVIGQIFDKIGQVGVTGSEAIQNLGLDIEELLDDIQGKIDSKIADLSATAGNALHDLTSRATTELKEAAADGAENLKSKLKEQIGASFGTSSSKGKGTDSVVTSLLSWSYSDYLQLFLLVGMVTSPEAILLRTADIIELNMQKIDGHLGFVEVTEEHEVSRLFGLIKTKETTTSTQANEDAFKLSKSYTYLNIKATIEVKPLLLTLPLMANTVRNELTGTNWYQITYNGTLGY